MKTSTDHLMNGSITLEQPLEGYRVAIDPVFLASFVPAQAEESILDVGCGVGAAMLCLARRVEKTKIIGLELQPEYARLASRNIQANQLQTYLEVVTGDLLTPPPRLAASSFHHVMTNPPYYLLNKVTPSAHGAKATATVEMRVTLKQWIDFCLLMVRPKGTLSLILPTDRLEDVLPLFHPKAGDISIYPLWPSAQKSAKRLLIRARKNSHASTKIFPGLVLHNAQGKYSEDAEKVLRHCGAIQF
jgi:tRNA1(Val) A37 N6-methylase TrmN6